MHAIADRPVDRFPVLYQVNTRVTLTELSRKLGRPVTLDDFPDAELDRLAKLGFDWIWLLSVWRTGAAAQHISRNQPQWRREFEHTLADLRESDIAGSGFAINDYSVHPELGGPDALVRLRARMRKRGLKLMLDFVPNHMAPDHAWIEHSPDFFVHGGEPDLAAAPQNYFRMETREGSRIFAHGRDPYFDGWPDTVQLNYGCARLQSAMIGELARIAAQCDGVRCDMAMLVQPEVFKRTWGIDAEPFWPKAIEFVRRDHPQFLFLAEVYWDMEWAMQRQGFDFAYDKRLYDRLRDLRAGPVRDHLRADLEYQNHLARFLENHDEPRAAATFEAAPHAAAAVLTYLTPGLRFFHDGQCEGRRVRISPHLVRRPEEAVAPEISDRYAKLLAVLRHPVMRDGRWTLLHAQNVAADNASAEHFIAFCWERRPREWLCVVANYSPHQAQCFLRLPFGQMAGRTVRLKDLLSTARYDRGGDEMLNRGLYLDLGPWGCHVFEPQWIT